jgi:hypothetical protein
MMGRADLVTSLMFIKWLLEQLSRYLEFDRRQKGRVPVVRSDSC